MRPSQQNNSPSNRILELLVLVTLFFCSVAMLLSAYFNHLAVGRLAEQSLLTTAFALSNTVEHILFEQSPLKMGQIRETISDRVVAYAMIVNKQGKIVFHSNPSLENTNITIDDGLLEAISRGPKGKRITLQTGLPAYEFNYPLHHKEGTVNLLRLVLHTYPADNLMRGTWPIWWSLSAGVLALWASGLTLIYLLRKQTRIEIQRTREEQWTALGRMSAVIAHEFRNAIGGIKGFIQWVDEKTGTEDPRKRAIST
jgi:two-component system sensor histidine kinase HydH